MRSCGIDGLQAVIEAELNDYADNVVEAVNQAVTKVGKDCTKECRELAPKRTGKYARGFTCKIDKPRFGHTVATVYNSKKPSLTHLLEKGHATADGTGRVAGKPHISIAEQHAIENLPIEIEKAVKR